MNLIWLSRLSRAHLVGQLRALDLVKQSLFFLHRRKSLHEDAQMTLSENDALSVTIPNTLESHFFEIAPRLVSVVGGFLADHIRERDDNWLDFLNSNHGSNREKRLRKCILGELVEEGMRVRTGVFEGLILQIRGAN